MPKVAIPDRLFFAADSDETPQHISCLSTFTLPDRATGEWLDELERRLRSQTAMAAPFNYRLRHVSLERVAPSWDVLADNEIDLEYHLRRVTIAAPGGDREMSDLLSQLHSTPLDLRHPLWEVLLIDGLEGNRIGLYFKVHHAIMDGVSGIGRLAQMITGDPTVLHPRALWTIGPAPTDAKPSVARRLRKAPGAAREGALTLLGLGRYAGTIATRGRFEHKPDIPVPFDVPRTLLNRPISGQRQVATLTYDFARIDRVAKSAGVKVNDVFLHMCSTGVREYLADFEALPAAPLTAAAPVNVRDDADELTANAFTVFVISLATDIADPIERLAAIARSSAAGKAQLQSLPKKTSELYPAVYMGPLIGASIVGLGGRTAPPFTISTSNVPGPLTP